MENKNLNIDLNHVAGTPETICRNNSKFDNYGLETARRSDVVDVSPTNFINVNSEADFPVKKDSSILINEHEDSIESMNSEDSEFLEIKLPYPHIEKIACFCEGGNTCLKHHIDTNVDQNLIVDLLK